ncbi:transmembrane gamma-carboxyglutamic acid protein 4 isoform X1 [Caretta caretta]|uniref:transmembrane gamma-carboxyglutamic acid protein 4 isoform X1 n=1 Tax=Caretta caretta TaxID=8467 RepID=UPI003F4B1548
MPGVESSAHKRDTEQELSYAGDARAHAEARLGPGGRQAPRAGLSSACGGWVLRTDPVWPGQVPPGAALGETAAGPRDPGCSLSGKRRGAGGARVVFVPRPSARSPGAAARAVFTSEKEANLFIGRHLLYNRFDFEVFTPGNLERECYEELCNYEEAREIFEDPDKMMTFWKEYSIKGPSTKFGGEATQNIDVTGLLTGLVATGVLLVTTGLLIYYFYKNRCKARQPPGYSDSVRSRRHEEVSLNPLSLRTDESGLPTYEEAVTLGGKYDVPPPPYLGPAKGFKMFKKSLSLPAP